MKLLGFELTRTKAAPTGLQIPEGRGGWWPVIREAFAGSWQQNVETPICDVLQHPTVFACLRLISGDVSKMRLDFTRKAGDEDIWLATDNPAFSPVLRKPNHYQDPVQFLQQWVLSKLLSGNTYVLKNRDDRGVVVSLYVLDPWRVKPLVAPDGSVFYQLKEDRLSTQDELDIVVPAREIIHDRYNCFFHPLVGISPLYAAGIPAILGLKIQKSSTNFFGGASIPAGILYTVGSITQPQADDLQARWTSRYGPNGSSPGGVAVIGDAMKFEVLTQPADKAQLNEQWLSAAEAIATAFGVPFYMVGGPMPPYNNIQAVTLFYYSQTIQPFTTAIENCLDVGLGLAPDKINGVRYGVQFKTKDLLLMDNATMMQTIRDGIGAGVLKPNEGRSDLNLLPVEGGDTPYLQQQNFSLAALDARDTAEPVAQPAPNAVAPPQPDVPSDQVEAQLDEMLRKELNLERAA